MGLCEACSGEGLRRVTLDMDITGETTQASNGYLVYVYRKK